MERPRLALAAVGQGGGPIRGRSDHLRPRLPPYPNTSAFCEAVCVGMDCPDFSGTIPKHRAPESVALAGYGSGCGAENYRKRQRGLVVGKIGWMESKRPGTAPG